jgi:hypothetical protein
LQFDGTNLGVGVTPSTWTGALKALQVGTTATIAGGSGELDLYCNAYNNGSNVIYQTSSYASQMQMNNLGQFRWFTAPSGTAGGTVTFTTSMTLNASGYLGIGTTSPNTQLHISASSAPTIQLTYSGTQAAQIAVASSQALTFGIDGSNGSTERMRIDNSGNLLVGTTSQITNEKLSVNTGNTAGITLKTTGGATYSPLLCWNATATGDAFFAVFATETSLTVRGSITYNRGGGLVAYNVTSDYRAKTVNGLVQNALSKVALLKPSTGRMNGATQDIDFFVAHELQEVVPSAVTGEKDAVNEDNTPKYQMVDKSALIPLLTAAIQELNTLITAQSTTIQSLTDRITALENK